MNAGGRVAGAFGAAVVAAFAVVVPASPAGAHPLGNVSVNHYAGVQVGEDEVVVDYVLDLAELPALQVRQDIDTDGDGDLSESESSAFEDERCATLAAGVELVVDGDQAPLGVDAAALAFLPGQAGLSILRLECRLSAAVGAAEDGTVVEVLDANAGERRGWREITAVGDGTTLVESDVTEASPSDRLTAYPEGVPLLDVRSARLVVDPGGSAAAAVGGNAAFGAQVRSATDTFTSLVASDRVTIPFVALALVVATVFGAVHALAPGHGKTVIAAYLVGQHSDRRMALVLGSTVAVTHTISVLAFGGLVWVSEAIAPESLYPAFGMVSGGLFMALGVVLAVQVRRRRRGGSGSVFLPATSTPVPVLAGVGGTAGPVAGAGPDGHVHAHAAIDHGHRHDHVHADDHGDGHLYGDSHNHGDSHDDGDSHGHEHGDGHRHDGSGAHEHDHDHDDAGWHGHSHVDLDAVAAGALSWRQVLLPGLAGGLVPSPSALLVFLGGLTLGRAWFGIGLVVGYGIGIGLTLVTAGWLLSRAGGALRSRAGRWPAATRIVAALPMVTAVLVILGGLQLAVRAAVNL